LKNKLKYLLLVIICFLCLIVYFVIDKKDFWDTTGKLNSNHCVDAQLDSLKHDLLLAEKNNKAKEIVISSINLGNCFRNKYDYNGSLLYFQKAYEFRDEIDKPRLVADITYKIALNYLELGDFIEAHAFALKTDSIEKSNKKISAESLNLLGSIYEKSGLYVKSLNTLYQSLELQKRDKNLIGVANSYHNIAHIYMQAGKYDKAHEYYSNALKIYEKREREGKYSLDNQVGKAKIYLSLGNYYNALNDSSNAFYFLKKALEIFVKAQNRLYESQAVLAIGNVHFRLRNFKKAEAYYLKALNLNDKEANQRGEIVINMNLARLYHYQNKKNEKISALKTALDLAKKVGAKSKLAEAAELLYSEYSNFQDSVEQAKEYATLFLKTNKYLPGDKMQDSIIQMSARHEVTLQKNEELFEERYKKNSRTVVFILILALSLTVFLFVYYRNKVKQRQLYEKKLIEEQKSRFREVIEAIESERKRIAVDLHDSLGQMLSVTKLYLSSLEEIKGLEDENNKLMYDSIVKMIDDSRGELRNISFNIMPGSFIKYGLVVAIDELANKINQTNQVEFHFTNTGFDKRLPENLEISIYRIVQEAVNNIVKHANATEIQVNMTLNRNTFNLKIADNGKGMEQFAKNNSPGLGWKSICSRVEMLEGSIGVNSAPGAGTEIEIVLPVG
jgi:two-component system NarL family sensor kinase